MRPSPSSRWAFPVKLILCWSMLVATSAELPLPSNLVALASPPGRTLLMSCNVTDKYFALAQHFTTQINGAFCGPASASMVLNALGVPRPMQAPSTFLNSSEYNYFDQQTLFSNATDAVVTAESIMMRGVSLPELAALLDVQREVQTSYVQCALDNYTADEFRTAVVASLQSVREFVIVNFNRALLGELGGGHHSPIAAYNEAQDMFLVLDVSRYKYTSWWVKATELYTAACTPDGSGNDARGLLFVSAEPSVDGGNSSAGVGNTSSTVTPISNVTDPAAGPPTDAGTSVPVSGPPDAAGRDGNTTQVPPATSTGGEGNTTSMPPADSTNATSPPPVANATGNTTDRPPSPQYPPPPPAPPPFYEISKDQGMAVGAVIFLSLVAGWISGSLITFCVMRSKAKKERARMAKYSAVPAGSHKYNNPTFDDASNMEEGGMPPENRQFMPSLARTAPQPWAQPQ